MKELLFYLYAGFGMAFLFVGLDLLPTLFSLKWWFVVGGYALIANAFKPGQPE